MIKKVRTPSCTSCSGNYYHYGLPQKKYGVMLHECERYCIGGKRARRFKKREPPLKVPDWCPKRSYPHKVRVFDFKNDENRSMFESLRLYLGEGLAPESHRYVVVAETTTELSAKEFWEQCSYDAGPRLLGITVPRYGIIEIDDGLLPNYFFYSDEGYRHQPHFVPPTTEPAKRRKGKLLLE